MSTHITCNTRAIEEMAITITTTSIVSLFMNVDALWIS